MTPFKDAIPYFEYASLICSISILFGILSIKGGIYAPLFILTVGSVLATTYLANKLKGAFFLFSLLLAIPVLEQVEGISVIEIPFYLASILMGIYLTVEIISGRIKSNTTHDRLYLFLILLLPFASMFGIVNGVSSLAAIGEVTYFLGLLFYFPLRKHLTNKTFQYLVLGIVVVFIGYVLIRNIVNYQVIITQAVLPWQAEKARVAANEFVLLMGACLFMSAAAVTRSFTRQIGFTLIFSALLGGLILTQSRGYWLAFFFGAIFIFYVINSVGKKRILLTLFFLGAGSYLFASIFFGGLLDTVLEGLALRFQSIGSGELDSSLKDRLYESQAVFALITKNPITGYGLGYTFTRHSLFFDIYFQTSFVHNGYLAAWFKLGLPGLITFVSIWILNIKYSIQLYNQTQNPVHQALTLGIAGTMIGVLFVNNTSAQILLFESVLFISLFSAYLNHFLKERKP